MLNNVRKVGELVISRTFCYIKQQIKYGNDILSFAQSLLLQIYQWTDIIV
jgi:hypothetical protein